MKISKSKQELARVISENGGWRNGAEFAWYGNQTKKGWFGISKPRYSPKQKSLQILRPHLAGSFPCRKPKNWHQTILSRAEYFHLYPAPDAKPEFCESVMRSIPEPIAKPTIEQLAADYRNAKDCAERKQQEADAAKVEADAKLAALVAAGKALGLVLSVEREGGAVTPMHPPLIAGDWRSWRQWEVGDFVSWSILGHIGDFKIIAVHHDASRSIGDFEIEDSFGGVYRAYGNECKFIRRP